MASPHAGTRYGSAGAGSSAGASSCANTSAGRCRVVPCTRIPARTRHQSTARRCASSMPSKSSPAKKLRCTNFTPASTRPLSCGEATLAGSQARPRACAYSSHSRFQPGSSRSALVTTGLRLSGTRTLNMPPKKLHADSQPAITATVVCGNVRYTKQYRENTAVNTSACSFRRRSPSAIIPRYPKSICTSSPGFPSATGTVTRGRAGE